MVCGSPRPVSSVSLSPVGRDTSTGSMLINQVLRTSASMAMSDQDWQGLLLCDRPAILNLEFGVIADWHSVPTETTPFSPSFFGSR